MAHTLKRVMTAALLAAGIVPVAQADFIQGQITDATGEAPLQGALVSVEGLNRTATTDRFGDYRLIGVPAGTYTVTVDYVGADTVTAEVTVPASGATLDLTLGADVRYLDNILVVGSSAAAAGAINQQRASDSIISVIDSDGLGNFPDTTVADSLARVSGISIENDQGEGRYVSIRGINTDLIAGSINGVRTPSPEDRRGVLLDGVPSDLLDGIEVQKSLTPDVDADTLGGVINLKTISAFDRDGRFIRAKLEGRYNDITEDVSPKATLTYSDVFGEKLGVAMSLNYQDLAIESHNNEAGGWDLTDGGIWYLNDDYEQRWYDLTRERIGFVGNIDYRLNDDTELYVRTFYNLYTDDEVRNKFELRDLDDVEDDGQIVENGIIVPLNEVDAEVRQREEVRTIQTYSAGGQTRYNDFTFDYEVAYAFAEEDDSDNHDVTFRFEDIQDLRGADDLVIAAAGGQPRFSGRNTLAAIYDPSNYVMDVFEQEDTVNDDTEISAKFDVSYDMVVGNVPTTFKAGLKYRDREKNRDVNLTFFEADDLSLADFVGDQLIDGWRLANPMPAWPDPNLTAALRDNAQGNFEIDEDATLFDSLAEDFTVEEQIIAGYGMFTADYGPTRVVAGVRLEQTNVDLTGNNFAEEAALEDLDVISLDDKYYDILPSINIRRDMGDGVVARAAYYASVVRPSFGDVAPFVVLNDDRDEAAIGNPTLEALEANNFDLSLEFYSSDLSVFSVGLFYKDIDNAIFPVQFEIEDGIPDGVDVSLLTTEQVATVEEIETSINVDSSYVAGIEVNYVQDLSVFNDYLDGFLLSGNATLTDSSSTLPDGREVPFLKQSDFVFNGAIAYDKGPWDLRVSANFRGAYIDELVDESLDRYTDDRFLIEASAKYKVNDNLQLYLEGKNLTDEPEYYYFGEQSRLSQYDEFGRTVIFGARVTY